MPIGMTLWTALLVHLPVRRVSDVWPYQLVRILDQDR